MSNCAIALFVTLLKRAKNAGCVNVRLPNPVLSDASCMMYIVLLCYLLSVTCFLLSAICFPHSAVCCLMPATYCLLPSIISSLPGSFCPMSAVCHVLPAVCCLPSASCYLLLWYCVPKMLGTQKHVNMNSRTPPPVVKTQSFYSFALLLLCSFSFLFTKKSYQEFIVSNDHRPMSHVNRTFTVNPGHIINNNNYNNKSCSLLKGFQFMGQKGIKSQ